MPIHCIDHQINLIITDICNLPFAKNLLKKCMKIVKFFKTSHKAGKTLRTEILKNMVKGGGLKSYVKTCWSTAFDCANSVLSCETTLKNVIYYNKQIAVQDADILNNDIKKIISNQHFYVNLEELLYATIKNLPEIRQVSFCKDYIEIFNKHWKQFDIELYILAFILHPKYHGEEMKISIFCKVIEYVQSWWNMTYKENNEKITFKI
ncbi:hypothetical protein C1646_768830 [Rhizophagus diaphanus]|nr:hypothetical protein C1646_768830 [Rhizophagus diaphanus] [Rhizophagus sp. MUCL 43196]